MQKWFNSLGNTHSILITILFILVGAYFFYLRITDQIGFGYFIGLGILVETTILNIKNIPTQRQRPIVVRKNS